MPRKTHGSLMAALETQQQPASDTPMEAAAPPEMPWWMQTPSVQRLLEEYDSKTDEERAEIKRIAEEAEEEAFIRIAARTTPNEPTAEGAQLRTLAAARYVSRLESVHDHVPKREELELFEDLIGKLGLRIDYDRYEVVRRKVLEAGGTPGFWEQAQNATRFFSVRPRAADGTVAVAALRQATFDEAESLCVLASRARKLPEGGVNLS